MLRFLPVSLYNVPAVETWLSDQARRGWHAAGFSGSGRMRFQRGEPEETVYRLEPQFSRDSAPDAEMLELYAAKGWTFVDRVGGFCLWRAARRCAGELHTDPVAESFAYDWVAQAQEEQIRMNLGVVFVYASLGFLFYLISDTVVLYLLDSIYLTLYPLSFFWQLFRSVADYWSLRRLRRQLLSGVPINHGPAPYRKKAWGLRASRLLVAALMVWSLFLAYSRETDLPLEELPVVPISELGVQEPMGKLWTIREHSLLAVSALSVSQSSQGNSWEEKYSWHAEAYHLRLPFLAGQTMRDLINTFLMDSLTDQPKGELHFLKTPLFDEACYMQSVDRQYLVARKGGRVLCYWANVPEDLRDHLDAFAAALADA